MQCVTATASEKSIGFCLHPAPPPHALVPAPALHCAAHHVYGLESGSGKERGSQSEREWDCVCAVGRVPTISPFVSAAASSPRLTLPPTANPTPNPHPNSNPSPTRVPRFTPATIAGHTPIACARTMGTQLDSESIDPLPLV